MKSGYEVTDDVVDDVGTGCLIHGAPLGSCPFKEKIEYNTK